MENNILELFNQQVLAVLKNTKTKFILFGSRARGDAEEYSDYDILIITHNKVRNAGKEIEEIEMDIFANYSVIINSHLFSEKELERLSFEPFIVNALAEGVAA